MAGAGPEAVKDYRPGVEKFVKGKIEALKKVESLLHSTLDPRIQKVLAKKRIVLFQEVIKPNWVRRRGGGGGNGFNSPGPHRHGHVRDQPREGTALNKGKLEISTRSQNRN